MKNKTYKNAKWIGIDTDVIDIMSSMIEGEIPCNDDIQIPTEREGELHIRVDIDTGKIYGWKNGTSGVLMYRIDLPLATVYDKDMNELASLADPMIPKELEFTGGNLGDCINMKIDMEGKIEGWKPCRKFDMHMWMDISSFR